ncbi:MAG: hypothetical protein AAGC55_20620 [Myxococcota bacterium]
MLLASLSITWFGCVVEAQGVDEASEAQKQLDITLTEEAQYIGREMAYLESSFWRVNAEPYPSELTAGNLIDVYLPPEELTDYGAIDPERSGSGATVPEATTLVRVVMDDALTPQSLTFMIKGPPGYFPGGGDFFYAVTDLDGTVVVGNDGRRQSGRLKSCAQCHADRADDGWLFGVPGGERGKVPDGDDL